MKSTKPRIIKAVSILLALLSVIGATVSAEVLNPIASQDGSEPVIVEEDIALRGTYEKHFIMSDGSSMAVAYNEPVHYEEDGQWFEIDNTLVETKGGRIANVKGLENVSFSQEPSQELVVIEKDGYTISWGLRFSTAPNAGLSASGRSLKGVETRELDPKATASVEAGYIPVELVPRLVRSQMSLEHLIMTLRANDLSRVRQIYLLHLSANNSDERRCREEIQKLTGAEVYVC